MKEKRLKLLQNLYLKAISDNDLNKAYILEDFQSNRFDYQYLHSKGYISIGGKIDARNAVLTVLGVDIVEEYSEIEN